MATELNASMHNVGVTMIGDNNKQFFSWTTDTGEVSDWRYLVAILRKNYNKLIAWLRHLKQLICLKVVLKMWQNLLFMTT